MDMLEALPVPKTGPFTRLLLKVAAVDETTLRMCPPQDWDNARAVGEIMLFSWTYQTALFAIIGHRLFAAPGQIRPELVLIAMFIASFILQIDSYVVLRSGWHLSGIIELKRGGIDISGGPASRIKAGLFLTIRILLSVCLAQLTAVFLSLLIFGADINARLDAADTQTNASLVQTATAQVDAAIQRATVSVMAETSKESALSAEVASLRQSDIDPSAGDAQVQQAQRELTDALTAKVKADEALQLAQTFASGELGGVPGPGHSGTPGDGVRHKAALEQVSDARSRADAAARDAEAARSRLDAFRRGAASKGKELRQRAHDQLPAYGKALAAEDARLSDLKQQLASLVEGRSAAIRDAVASAPDHVARDTGLLAQVAALEQIVSSDRKVEAVVILIDVISFAFELAAVLAKVTAFVPTTYAALLARDAYLQVVRIVDGMMATLGEETSEDEVSIIDGNGDSTNANPFAPAFAGMPADPFGGPPPAPPKRPRGRPRKSVLN